MIDFNYTLLIQFANLLILLILLNIFLFKPVLKVINKRGDAIDGTFSRIKSLKDDVENLEKQYDEKSMEQKRPLLQLKDSTIAEAHTTSMRIIEKAREELAEELTKMKADIEKEQRQVFDSLKMEVERLSSEAAEKIMKRSL
ncbi:MAG TPA: ATP synthase F0 subunit B [Syntrophorhabdaceae bacterium]|nr:ATP synthase F0 subunit B [Syntrophorhabdaceae bacterium]